VPYLKRIDALIDARVSIVKKSWLWFLVLPYSMFYLGAGLNLLVIACNHGTMPVVVPWGFHAQGLPGAMMDGVHQVYNATDVHLAFLCDWIFVPFLDAVVSPGDCLLWLGDWLQVPGVVAFLTLALFA
jgi:Family of unknown function (DUF5317)